MKRIKKVQKLSYEDLLREGCCSCEGFITMHKDKKNAVKTANILGAHIHCEENPNGRGYDYIVCNDERC